MPPAASIRLATNIAGCNDGRMALYMLRSFTTEQFAYSWPFNRAELPLERRSVRLRLSSDPAPY